jgi:PilZ domain
MMSESISSELVSERRADAPGRRVYGGKIVFNNGSSTLDCVVRDLSPKGARLEVASPIGIPNSFDLHINRNGARYPSKVAWSSGNQIGVMFIDLLGASF